MPRKTILQAALCLTICSACLMMPASSIAQTVIGSWLSAPIPPTPANDEGWQRGQGGFGPNGSIFASSNSPAFFELKAGVAAGYAQSLDIHETGFGNVRLFISLTPTQIAAFTNNSQLNFTMSCDSSDSSGSTAGFMQLVQFQCNSSGGGFQSPGINTAGGFSETGDTNNNSNGQPVFDFFAGSPARQQVVTWDYSSLKPAINGSTYAQFVFVFQVGGGAPTNIYINNVTLSTPPIQTTYIVDDFATNGVSPTNPTNHDFYANGAFDYSLGDITSVWSEWFGNGTPAFSWAPNADANGDTNSGAMAIQFTWGGFPTDGFQQWVAYHGFGQNTFVPVPGGSVGIGFPQYTNVECDVRFDASSVNVTNANFPNGVYGVLRLGIRPAGGGSQDWQPQANYTTITDTNWHHMSMPLTAANPDFANIGDAILGEDVTSYVDGVAGLNGQQTLYVDNIRFTGPLVAPAIPPPTLGAPQVAKPGLRVFAGSTANTYDRQQLFTVDANQSWADPGVTYPVKYSYSLQSYNPSITQVHLELTPGGSVAQYTDYGGNNLLWMVLSPGPANGQVVCSVQWKTNAPSSNPGGTANPYGNALSFTNSTAVGTWSLVFTGTNSGYVVAPGQVVLGQTNFTIADTNVVADFANPMQAVFGIQPNTTAGQGQYVDYGMFQITGVIGANESEDFTTEGSDISSGVTPSGQFNNSSSFRAASTIIVTTNDALWMNWTQPAIGFTLATSTNLAHPNWINPGWYSGYTDTNAPRVMPLSQPFAGKFWVLLPKDDLPTADGLQNPTPPDADPRAPTAFFILSTNVVSP